MGSVRDDLGHLAPGVPRGASVLGLGEGFEGVLIHLLQQGVLRLLALPPRYAASLSHLPCHDYHTEIDMHWQDAQPSSTLYVPFTSCSRAC